MTKQAAEQFTGYYVGDPNKQIEDPAYTVYTTISDRSGSGIGGSSGNGVYGSNSSGYIGGMVVYGSNSSGYIGGCSCGVIGCSGCGGSGITINPYTTTPSPTYTTGSGTITFSNVSQKYTVFKLPIKDMVPNKVYVSGRLITVGILGSDVQAAFTGDKIVFSPGELEIIKYNERLTVSLDYGDWVYHYNVDKNVYGSIDFEEDSNIVKAKLVSKVKQR